MNFDLTPIFAFTALTVVASITPGPAVLLVMAHGLKGGWMPSFKASLGVQAGNGIYLTLSAIGLGAILAASETLFHAVKWIGAGYLVYLGLKTIRNARAAAPTGGREPILARPFTQATMAQLANPKSVLFFGALMPQFLQLDHPLLPQYLAFAVICFVVEVPVLAFYGWIAARGRGLFANPRSIAWRERLSGGALVAVGASIAAVKRAG
jgi:homoserine/homoserine lactone efflux protein